MQTVRTGGYYNAGRFVAELGDAVATIKYGTQQAPDTELGPLISAAHQQKVMGLIERALSRPHISRVTGGSSRQVNGAGFFCRTDGARQSRAGR